MDKLSELRVIQGKFEELDRKKSILQVEWFKKSSICPERNYVEEIGDYASWYSCGKGKIDACDHFLCPLLRGDIKLKGGK